MLLVLLDGICLRQIVIIGNSESAQEMHKLATIKKDLGYRIKATFSDYKFKNLKAFIKSSSIITSFLDVMMKLVKFKNFISFRTAQTINRLSNVINVLLVKSYFFKIMLEILLNSNLSFIFSFSFNKTDL